MTAGKDKEDIAEIVSEMKISDKKAPPKEESDDEDIPDIEDADMDDNIVEEEDPVCHTLFLSPSSFWDG